MEAHTGFRSLVLFVCAANVCRSPAAEFLTWLRFHEQGVRQPWTLLSAGADAQPDLRICTEVAQALEVLPGGTEFAEGHRSHVLDAELVDHAGLILVASQLQRSAVARLSPSARARTFTMVEAALLAESAVARDMSLPEGTGLEEVSSALHRNRGAIANQARPARGSLFGRRATDRPSGLDIGDVHTGEVKTHAPVIADLHWTALHLGRAMAALTTPSPEAAPGHSARTPPDYIEWPEPDAARRRPR